MKNNGVNYSMDNKVQERRKRVIVRLEKQLKEGTKMVVNTLESLTVKDVNRQEW